MIYVSADKGKNGGNSMKAREIRFGRNVKALRELHHVTQSQLAEAIHISQDMKILVGSRSLQEECLGTERMIVI